MVVDYASPASEAASFVHLNQQRRPLNKLDVFKAWVDAAIAAEQKYAPAAQTIWTMLVPLVTAIVAARKAQAGKVG